MSGVLGLARDMPVIVQCADLQAESRWIDAMRRYGTNVVACVSPAADQDRFADLPLFRHCAEARSAAEAAACVSMLPPRTAADGVLEAAEAGIGLVVSLSPGIPVHDTMRIRRWIGALDVTWIGGASSGVARPADGVMLGAVPVDSLLPGSVALLSTDGDLAAEAGFAMRQEGVGQSLYVDVGSNLVKGTRLDAMIEHLKADDETRAVALLGSAGGSEEEEFARSLQRAGLGKPVLAYVAGRALPDPAADAVSIFPGGADAARKEAALADAGVRIYNSLGALIAALKALA